MVQESDFCEYHRQRGHNTSVYIWLKHEIQDLIDNGLISTGIPIALPNQYLGIFNNPFPKHDANHVSVSLNLDQAYHSLDPPASYDFVGWTNLVTFSIFFMLVLSLVLSFILVFEHYHLGCFNNLVHYHIEIIGVDTRAYSTFAVFTSKNFGVGQSHSSPRLIMCFFVITFW